MSTKESQDPRHETESPVLLVCVYDTVIFELNNQLIYFKFQKYGAITKLLIFEKAEVTKFFIEYSSVESAKAAKLALDGTKLYDTICKMSIYYSNFVNVDLKHQTSEGIDYAKSQNDKKSFIQKFDQLSISSQKTNLFADKFFQFNEFQIFAPHSRSKTDDPRILAQIWNIKQSDSAIDNQLIIEVDQKIKSDIVSLLDSDQETSGGTPDSKNRPAMKFKEDSLKKNTILAFYLAFEIEMHCIYNFFSNFGNVSSITIKKDEVFVKFRTVEFAAIAHSYLSGKVLFGNHLDLRFLSEQTPQQREGQYSQCMYFDSSYDRFTPKKSITVNPPSNTLHVSGIKKDICRVNTLRDIFEQFAQVEKVSILQQSSEKNMALVKFNSMEDSFAAISELHNRTFSGRKMQISFTKSRV